MLFVCYPKCTTCQKAAKWLDAQGIPVTVRDIKQDNPTEQELRTWHKMSGLPLKRPRHRTASDSRYSMPI